MKKRILGTVMAFAVASLGMMACERAKEHHPTVKQLEELTLDCGKGASVKLVLIPAGEFMMGGDEPPDQVARKCNEWKVEKEQFQDEYPQHRVKMTKPFYMGVYVVTQTQYEAVTGVNPSYFKGESNPVDRINWNDAVDFCKKLSVKTGQTVRLPTEAEWEYACRAGTTTPFNTGKTISPDQANYNGTYTYGSGRKGVFRGKPVAVGSFPPNAWGLYDMHGNVLEWCQDWYGSYPAGEVVDPQGPAKGQSRVLRGSGWTEGPAGCRSADRAWSSPSYTSSGGGYGFRVVCEPKQ